MLFLVTYLTLNPLVVGRREFLVAVSSQLIASSSIGCDKAESNWVGTSLPLQSLQEAVTKVGDSSTNNPAWPMARWPDPILRRAASPVPEHYFATEILLRACELLRNTAIQEKAVGLAAEQCGVNARIIYLQDIGQESSDNKPKWLERSKAKERRELTMVNPRIVGRSPETEMKVWEEHCLVLPPSFSATVLRDAWVDVEYQDPATIDRLPHDEGVPWKRIRLYGEPARAFQHEFDHDRGILITDHVDYADMENSRMVAVERRGHAERMKIAYSREVCELRATV